jgi:MFS family permease
LLEKAASPVSSPMAVLSLSPSLRPWYVVCGGYVVSVLTPHQGGLVYGYNQGMFGQVLSMTSFAKASGVTGIQNPVLSGLLTSILELGAWVGVLANGILADRLGRKLCVVVACFFFIIGVIIQACTRGGSYSYIFGGRFVTGLGVGSLSMIVPLYNAELSPPEIRGSLVALQQVSRVPSSLVGLPDEASLPSWRSPSVS